MNGDASVPTPLQQRTLYCIAKDPGSTDKEIAECCGAEQASVAKARRALWERGYFSKVLLLQFQNIGYRYMTMAYINSIMVRFEVQRKKIVAPEDAFSPEDIFELYFTNIHMAMRPHRLKDDAEAHDKALRHHWVDEVGVEPDLMDVLTADLRKGLTTMYYNYASVVAHVYDLKDLPTIRAATFFKDDRVNRRITDAEREVLFALGKYPPEPAEALAKRLKLTRDGLDKVVQGLVDANIASRGVIVNVHRLNMDFLHLFRVTYKKELPLMKRRPIIEWSLNSQPMFIKFEEELDTFGIGCYKSHEEYDKKLGNIADKILPYIDRVRIPSMVGFSIPPCEKCKFLDQEYYIRFL